MVQVEGREQLRGVGPPPTSNLGPRVPIRLSWQGLYLLSHLSRVYIPCLYFYFILHIFIFIYGWIFCLMYVCAAYACRVSESQKKVLDPLELEPLSSFKPPCVCWEPNLAVLQEQQELSATAISSAPSMAVVVLAASVFCVCKAFSKYLLNKCWCAGKLFSLFSTLESPFLNFSIHHYLL